jgi:predicted nucleic acid-binding protein
VKRTYTLIVTDTSPLITLALAGELDLLLRLGTPVSIPDAVFNEATRVRTAGGASAIVEWVNAHLDQVHIAPTEVGIDQQRRLEEGRSTRGLGEAAALETLDRVLSADTEAEALLLFEDSDIMRRRVIVGERVDLISTCDFLRELEAAHLIQSTDRILDVAAEAGRNMQRQRETTSDDSARASCRSSCGKPKRPTPSTMPRNRTIPPRRRTAIGKPAIRSLTARDQDLPFNLIAQPVGPE